MYLFILLFFFGYFIVQRLRNLLCLFKIVLYIYK